MTGYIAFGQTSKDKKLMKLFVDNPDYVRRVVISDNQASIVRWLMESGEYSVTSRMLADWKCISLNSASAQLSNLWKTGYLLRKTALDPTGGITHRYSSAI